MIADTDTGISRFGRLRRLAILIRQGEVSMAGYTRQKIYGTLSCASGKRMKATNRVFFKNEQEAIGAGYRPCGNCMRQQYRAWKMNTKNNQ